MNVWNSMTILVRCDVRESIFRKHAKQRIKERTKMTTQDISNLLGRGVHVNLGSKPGIHKSHLLLYSVVDSQYYVLVQDKNNGDIISFLPLEYHENLAWKVPEEHRVLALEKATKFNVDKLSQPVITTQTTLPLFNVCYKYDSGCGHFKTKKFCTTDMDNRSIDEFIVSDEFRCIAREIIEIGGCDISVSIGDKGFKRFIDCDFV